MKLQSRNYRTQKSQRKIQSRKRKIRIITCNANKQRNTFSCAKRTQHRRIQSTLYLMVAMCREALPKYLSF
jgi:hypothetical protein